MQQARQDQHAFRRHGPDDGRGKPRQRPGQDIGDNEIVRRGRCQRRIGQAVRDHAPDQWGDAIAARDLVDKILASLSPEDRSLILMVDLEGRSLQEISETTGWSISKIKMRLFRVRPQLRQMIRKLEERN